MLALQCNLLVSVPGTWKYLVTAVFCNLVEGSILVYISLDTCARITIDSQVRSIHPSPPDYGRFTGDVLIGGHWTYVVLDHINSLEL